MRPQPVSQHNQSRNAISHVSTQHNHSHNTVSHATQTITQYNQPRNAINNTIQSATQHTISHVAPLAMQYNQPHNTQSVKKCNQSSSTFNLVNKTINHTSKSLHVHNTIDISTTLPLAGHATKPVTRHNHATTQSVKQCNQARNTISNTIQQTT